jgi:hypothetical protein
MDCLARDAVIQSKEFAMRIMKRITAFAARRAGNCWPIAVFRDY